MKINIGFSSFFSNVQETPWYQEFLEPVVSLVSPYSNVLDIGTGTGKLLQLLVSGKSAVCTGIDVSSSMLIEAEKKLVGLPVKLILIKSGDALPFQNNSFDVICICNVLFNLDFHGQVLLLDQALEKLNESGRIVILNPTGTGTIRELVRKVSKKNNLSFTMWNALTRRRAWNWNRQHIIKKYADKYELSYSNSIVLDGFGHMEIIKKE